MGSNKRRARGTGSLFFSKALGLWIGRTSGGLQQVSGKTQAECIERLKKLKPPSAKITLAEWGKRWLESLSNRPATYISYEQNLRCHIEPDLGFHQLASLTTVHVNQVVKVWLGKGLSPHTVKLLLTILRACLTAAVDSGVIPSNPATRAKSPRLPKVKIDPFTVEELKAILERLDPRWPIHQAIGLLATTGARVGEIVGLEVSDLNPVKGTISISKQHNHKSKGPPKSENSVRELSLSPEALRFAANLAGNRTLGPLVQQRGRRILDNILRYHWKVFLARLGWRHRKLHELRHTVASLLIASGESLADVARYLGDTAQTVLKTYLHPMGSDPGKRIGELLGGKTNAEPHFKPADVSHRRSNS